MAWSSVTDAVTSELTRIECLRTLDRARVQGRLDDATLAPVRKSLLAMLEGFTVIGLDPWITTRAAEPFPTLIGTLDALHLATAIAARVDWPDLAFATHDRELATAAESVGFDVLV